MHPFRTWIRRYVKHGSNRTVILLPNVVVKIGISPVRVARTVSHVIHFVAGVRRNPTVRTRKFWQRFVWYELQRALLSGIRESRRERRLSDTMLHSVIAPTYWACFGIITIAERVPQMPPYRDETIIDAIGEMKNEIYALWCRVHPEPECSQETADICHTFGEDNFGIRDGRLVLLDYGAMAFEELMARAPEEVIRIFRDANTKL